MRPKNTVTRIRKELVNMHHEGANISATNLQSRIGGVKLTKEQLQKHLDDIRKEKGLNLRKATTRTQPKTSFDRNAAYLKVRPFIVQMTLQRKPISAKLIREVFGCRQRSAEKFIELARRDKDVVNVLNKNNCVISLISVGQNHGYNINELKRKFNSQKSKK